ncbi:MAG: YbaN family protein [Oscillospiraceae bacterium]
MKKLLLVTAGAICLGLGILGSFLPLLPTTPFVLCAAGCFGASSPKLYNKLAASRLFGEYVRSYKEKTGISRKTRIKGIAILWLGLFVSAFLFRNVLVWGILCIVGICVSIHIWVVHRKYAPPDNAAVQAIHTKTSV